MTDNKIRSLANIFREKIDRAKCKDLFVDTMLEDFPEQCCGVASTLLAEFLHDNGVETLWISSEELGTFETHAWLVVKDNRVDSPRSCFDGVPNNIKGLISKYGGTSGSLNDLVCYDEQSIENGLIIDITGDQFGEDSVYVGYIDSFHKDFNFISAEEHKGLLGEEHIKLYEIILKQ